ncbi:hypothetical protein PMAYCL1PPCAC_29612 [Pristionchus mayeri]|uniref:Uncharacterized protein n=1 Tax=Pristionchus mayeri TaxID=1317129 RepID=A0AAN5DBA7_9BILA|nr:hypothetical protein PMAYCL1PPCAC_29612 [Pristionchus mayeri]
MVTKPRLFSTEMYTLEDDLEEEHRSGRREKSEGGRDGGDRVEEHLSILVVLPVQVAGLSVRILSSLVLLVLLVVVLLLLLLGVVLRLLLISYLVVGSCVLSELLSWLCHLLLSVHLGADDGDECCEKNADRVHSVRLRLSNRELNL